ncbi:uncharacterized protein [Magallana gigas]|uniref:uncharacterized protein isoform X2 n=1 Tax=Magallana gigas TaxID=29159 RepID=UPI00333EBEAD
MRCTKNLDILFFVLHEDAFLTQPPAMLLSLFFLCVVGPLSGVFGLPWNLPPNFRYRPEWDSLRVKWGLNIFSENNFRSLPRKVSDAHDSRFALLRDECQEIEQAKKEGRKSRAKFAGRRYWKNNDPSVVLIYDTNGYVAGMQTAIRKKILEKDGEIMKSIGVWKDDEKIMMQSKSHDKSAKETLHRIRRQVQTSSTSPASSTSTLGSSTTPSGLGTPTHSTGTPMLFTETPSMLTGTPTHSPGTPTPFTDTKTLFPATSSPIPGSSTTFHETRTHVSGTHINTPETSFTNPQGGSSTKNPEFSKDQMEVLLKRPLLYPYVEDEEFLFFTVYFIKPERICNPKQAQTVDEFEHFGTGSGLYMQNGTGVNSVIEIPRDEQKLQENHPWKAEKCFWTQGKIYSYNFHEDQDCKAQFPLLLNYNKGRLTGFAMLWKMDFSSPNLEHPDKGLLKYMFEKVPNCYKGIGRLTKLQVYFTNHFLSHRC